MTQMINVSKNVGKSFNKRVIQHQSCLSNQYYQSTASTCSTVSIIKPIIAFMICASSVSAHAAILNNTNDRRIQVRYNESNDTSSVYIRPSYSTLNNGSTMLNNDSIQRLIEQKQRETFSDGELSIKENQRVINSRRTSSYSTANTEVYNTSNYNMDMSFSTWLNSDRYRAQQVTSFQRYLNAQIGAGNVPPLQQLLTTARSWDKCGYEPYQLPPQELWSNIVPTLKLYSALKSQGVLPASSEIRSAYRSSGLNDCAGGANNSKHMTGGAIDIWVPEYDGNLWQISTMQDSLCQFWQYQGQSYNFGLGLYSTGAIHLDTQGYRKWGFNSVSSSSACRY